MADETPRGATRPSNGYVPQQLLRFKACIVFRDGSANELRSKKTPDRYGEEFDGTPAIFDELLKAQLLRPDLPLPDDVVILRIATVCSGIDAPIFALKEILEAGRRQGLVLFSMQHVYACEIEPWKRDFLARNSKVEHIYCDVLELSQPNGTEA